MVVVVLLLCFGFILVGFFVLKSLLGIEKILRIIQ